MHVKYWYNDCQRVSILNMAVTVFIHAGADQIWMQLKRSFCDRDNVT